MYIIQYIQTQILDVLATTIDKNEINAYAKDSVGNYIKEGYSEKIFTRELFAL